MIVSAAFCERKTILGFLPLPRTMNSRLDRSIWSRVREASSETLRPVEYRVSRIARSRAPAVVVASTASKILSSSSLFRTSTVRAGIFESSIFSGASVSMSFFMRNFRNARSAMM